jgi:proteic killer suppression protein
VREDLPGVVLVDFELRLGNLAEVLDVLREPGVGRIANGAHARSIGLNFGSGNIEQIPCIRLWPVAHRKLDMLNAAHDLLDLRVPPGNKLEKLRGDLAGFWSIRINDQFRVIFRFAEGNASDVRIADYH